MKTFMLFLAIAFILTAIYIALLYPSSKGFGTIGYRGNYNSGLSIFHVGKMPSIHSSNIYNIRNNRSFNSSKFRGGGTSSGK